MRTDWSRSAVKGHAADTDFTRCPAQGGWPLGISEIPPPARSLLSSPDLCATTIAVNELTAWGNETVVHEDTGEQIALLLLGSRQPVRQRRYRSKLSTGETGMKAVTATENRRPQFRFPRRSKEQRESEWEDLRGHGYCD
ncbi:hypothetical protein SKAU_G00391830 [Synaphobranchus kaupii]|uniref:Uncharacterized protein n=1 Tax=Synaphobranchus kaupii TaxID=118154 RepID=A0A9Q1EBT0_SYNKA|nr:hypothetical protein SKAU_G00391830 [Synaphobranchus kaupii]